MRVFKRAMSVYVGKRKAKEKMHGLCKKWLERKMSK